MIIRNGFQILTELAELEKVISTVEELFKKELTEEELEIILRSAIKSVLQEKDLMKIPRPRSALTS